MSPNSGGRLSDEIMRDIKDLVWRRPLSISEPAEQPTDFNRWLASEFARTGDFTALAVLVEITESKVLPLCSTYFHVIGVETDWAEMTVLFAGAGREWDGASFFPVTSPHGGVLDNPNARLRLRELESRLDDNPLGLNEGNFFDKWGRRLKVEEVAGGARKRNSSALAAGRKTFRQ